MTDIEQYKTYREVGTQLNSDILDAYSDRELIVETAAELDIEFDGRNLSYRDIPDDETVKEVALKKEPTGEWYASFAVDDKEEPAKPPLSDIDAENMVGIDVGILLRGFVLSFAGR